MSFSEGYVCGVLYSLPDCLGLVRATVAAANFEFSQALLACGDGIGELSSNNPSEVCFIVPMYLWGP